MDDEARHCALPGCDETIRTAVGRPERRYCTPAHRAAARQARRAAGRVTDPPRRTAHRVGLATVGACAQAAAWPRPERLPRLQAVTGPGDVRPHEGRPEATVFALDERRDLRVRGPETHRPAAVPEASAQRAGEPVAAPRATAQERARATMDRLRAQARRIVEEAEQARVAEQGPPLRPGGEGLRAGREDDESIEERNR